MRQQDFFDIFNSKPEQFAWFLGAGASRSSGLPTAEDIIWDLKRRQYCKEENREVSLQDIQNPAVKSIIQSYMEAKGFPERWSSGEYAKCFEMIFGDDIERQRKYIQSVLSEKNISLSVGNRVLGALIGTGLCRVIFSTNFDTVVEKSVAEVCGISLSAYHLEGSYAANKALNNEEFPLYCKIHGDFRYQKLMNLPKDLETQNLDLSQCLINAANRFGFIIAGYSGRDNSVMELLHQALATSNPFPHGLYWLGMKGSKPPEVVTHLITSAKTKGITAEYIEIETFDAFMIKLWRNVSNKSSDIDAKVKKSDYSKVNIELPQNGMKNGLIRLNALPFEISSKSIYELSLGSANAWEIVQNIDYDIYRDLIYTRSSPLYCWGKEERIRRAFEKNLTDLKIIELSTEGIEEENFKFKSLIEEAIGKSLVKNRPLLYRIHQQCAWLITDPVSENSNNLQPLFDIIGQYSGDISGLYTQATEQHPEQQRISWAEALRFSIDFKNGKPWLLIEPDIWIWPKHGRKDATDFIRKRKSKRYNQMLDGLLNAWISIIFDNETITTKKYTLSEGVDAELYPSFNIMHRTAYSKESGV